MPSLEKNPDFFARFSSVWCWTCGKVTAHEITFRWGGRCFMCKEGERMRIELVSNYITSAYLNMAIFLVTTLVAGFAVLVAAILAKQLQLIEFSPIGVAAEVVVWITLKGQNAKFERRLEFLDTLIKKIEASPPIPLGSLKEIIAEVRRQ